MDLNASSNHRHGDQNHDHDVCNQFFSPCLVPIHSPTVKEKLSTPSQESVSGENREMSTSISGGDDEDDASLTTMGHTEDAESTSMESFSLGDLTIGSLAMMSVATGFLSEHEERSSSIIYETSSTRILHMHDPQKRSNEKIGSMAIKIIVEQFPSTECISRLENEYRVSRHLSNCTSTRSAFHRIANEGHHAIYLEWVEGTTLAEWISSTFRMDCATPRAQNNMNGITESDLRIKYENVALLALEISKALEEIHQFGVVHNNLTVENIIVNSDKDGKGFSVKIIDLGAASILENDDTGPSDGCDKQNDIVALGAVFYELFCGKKAFKSVLSASTNTSKFANIEEQTNVPGQKVESINGCKLDCDFSSMMNSTVPVCIFQLVLNLTTKSRSEYLYRSVSEVVVHLKTILANPQQYFLDTNDNNVGRLEFPKNKLYGCDRHMTTLMNAYNRVCRPDGTSEVVLVSGCSGSGKSVLIQHFRRVLSTKNVNFLFGKFEQFQQRGPLSAIISAFTEFCEELTAGDNEHLRNTRKTVRDAVGPDCGILESMIPSLRAITGAPVTVAFKCGGVEAQNRFKYMFRLFVRAIASQTQPLLLCLDDLQWIDPASLELVESLITDSNNSSLLLIGLYRENDVTAEHPLSIQLKNIENKVNFMTKINVHNLDRTSANELISDTLQMPTSSTWPLADAIYRKTCGNALFVLRLIKSLYEEGMISFSFDTMLWQWDVESVNSKKISDNIVGLMSRKILRFPEEAQSALKIIACLGSLTEELIEYLIVDKSIEEKFVKSFQCFNICRNYDNLLEWLDFSVDEGLIDHMGSEYKFAHNQIQLAVYSLIPEDERGLWHLQIGIQLWSNKVARQGSHIFMVVGQLNRGLSFVKDKYQKLEVANLNFLAGEKAVSLAAYPSAAVFLETGINLLDEKCWRECYNMSLKLYNLYAEVCFWNGHFEKMNQSLDTIFASATCFNDKYQAYFTQVRALGAQTKTDEILKVALFVLEQLGEPFPTTFDQSTVAAELVEVNQMLEGKSEAEILNRFSMEDEKKIAAVKLLVFVTFYFSVVKSKYFALFVLRLVRLSVSHGLCAESATGFATFGYLLRGSFDDIGHAYHYGQISLRLVEKFKQKNDLVWVFSAVFSGINSWKEHHQASIEPLKNAYKIGMSCGQIQPAFSCATQYCIHLYQCGEKLESVEKSMTFYVDEMLEHKQEIHRKRLQICRQTVLNLMGKSDDPLKLTDKATDQDSFLSGSPESKVATFSLPIYFNLSWLAYLFGNYELASQMAERAQATVEVICSPTFSVGNHVFTQGLISLALARKTKLVRYQSIAINSIQKMKTWSEYAPSNFQHKLLLLQAEYDFSMKSNKDAAVKYNMAIEKAGENGFIQDQAVAYELAALFHLSEGDVSKASLSYGRAHDTYLKWGAQAKADHLRLNYPF